MGKKKQFIDKKQSVVFKLVDRSHEDPRSFDSNNQKVWRASAVVPDSVDSGGSKKRKEEQLACGIYFDDDYDYMKHVKDPYSAAAAQKSQQAKNNEPLWQVVEQGQFDDDDNDNDDDTNPSTDAFHTTHFKKQQGSSSEVMNSDEEFPSLSVSAALMSAAASECESAAEKRSSQHHLPSSLLLHAVENDGNYNAMAASAQNAPGPHWDDDIAATMADDFNEFGDDLEDDFVALAGGNERIFNDDSFPEFGSNDDAFQNSSTGKRGDDWKYVLKEMGDDSCDYDEDDEVDREEQELDDLVKELNIGTGADNGKSEKSRFTQYSMTSSAIPRSEYQTDIDDHFETMYGEYDDLEVGALEHEELRGYVKADHPSILDILSITQQGIKTISKKGRKRGEYKFEYAPDEDDGNETKTTEHTRRLKQDESGSDSDSDSDIPFPQSPKKPEFDCESILSTYSNIYNRPKVIQTDKKIKLDENGLPKDSSVKIVANFEEMKAKADGEKIERLKWIPPNVKRREETKEERRERQKIQKEEQRLRRMEKKNNKIAFKTEEIRQQRADINKNRTSGIKL